MTRKSQTRQSNCSTAFVLNIVFAIIEIVGGLLTNSVAILSDALHDKTADEKYEIILQNTPAGITYSGSRQVDSHATGNT